jgi:hypothetical protein
MWRRREGALLQRRESRNVCSCSPQAKFTPGLARELCQAERRAATAADAAAALDSEEDEEEDEELQGDAIDEESQRVTRCSRRKRMAVGAKEAGLGLAGSTATVTAASVHLLKCLVRRRSQRESSPLSPNDTTHAHGGGRWAGGVYLSSTIARGGLGDGLLRHLSALQLLLPLRVPHVRKAGTLAPRVGRAFTSHSWVPSASAQPAGRRGR